MLLRREIRRREGLLLDIEDLGAALHALLSTEAREQIGPFKIRRKRGKRSAAAPAEEIVNEPPQQAPPTDGEPESAA